MMVLQRTVSCRMISRPSLTEPFVRDLLEQVGAVEHDAAQGVVDLVGYSGCHPSQGREFFRLNGEPVVTGSF